MKKSEKEFIKNVGVKKEGPVRRHAEGPGELETDDVIARGGTLLVAQLVEALRYKLEGRGFDSRWFHWIFCH